MITVCIHAEPVTVIDSSVMVDELTSNMKILNMPTSHIMPSRQSRDCEEGFVVSGFLVFMITNNSNIIKHIFCWAYDMTLNKKGRHGISVVYMLGVLYTW